MSGVMYRKSRPNSNLGVKGQGHRGQKLKAAESSPLTMLEACAVGDTQQHDTIAWPPGMTGYAGGKISACCVVCLSAR